MRGTLETIISTAIEKLSLSTLLALLPIAIAVYLFIYVEDKEIEQVFGIENSSKSCKKDSIVCPKCNESFLLDTITTNP